MHLVDTSVWIHALRPKGSPMVKEKLRPLILSGQAALTDWIVLELMTGIRSHEEGEALNAFLTPLPWLPVTPACWEISQGLAVILRKKGITPSAADCLIGAAAIHHQTSLIHLDQDFVDVARYSSLKEISWIGFL